MRPDDPRNFNPAANLIRMGQGLLKRKPAPAAQGRTNVDPYGASRRAAPAVGPKQGPPVPNRQGGAPRNFSGGEIAGTPGRTNVDPYGVSRGAWSGPGGAVTNIDPYGASGARRGEFPRSRPAPQQGPPPPARRTPVNVGSVIDGIFAPAAAAITQPRTRPGVPPEGPQPQAAVLTGPDAGSTWNTPPSGPPVGRPSSAIPGARPAAAAGAVMSAATPRPQGAEVDPGASGTQLVADVTDFSSRLFPGGRSDSAWAPPGSPPTAASTQQAVLENTDAAAPVTAGDTAPQGRLDQALAGVRGTQQGLDAADARSMAFLNAPDSLSGVKAVRRHLANRAGLSPEENLQSRTIPQLEQLAREADASAAGRRAAEEFATPMSASFEDAGLPQVASTMPALLDPAVGRAAFAQEQPVKLAFDTPIGRPFAESMGAAPDQRGPAMQPETSKMHDWFQTFSRTAGDNADQTSPFDATQRPLVLNQNFSGVNHEHVLAAYGAAGEPVPLGPGTAAFVESGLAGGVLGGRNGQPVTPKVRSDLGFRSPEEMAALPPVNPRLSNTPAMGGSHPVPQGGFPWGTGWGPAGAPGVPVEAQNPTTYVDEFGRQFDPRRFINMNWGQR